jgi:hypothetical protein
MSLSKNRGVNSFIKLGGGASSNATRRHCPAASSILPKSGGQLPPSPFIDAPEKYLGNIKVLGVFKRGIYCQLEVNIMWQFFVCLKTY